jgi:transposase-like protein
VNKHTTSGFCAQGHLGLDQVKLVEVDEAIRRAMDRQAMGERVTALLDAEVDAELGWRGQRGGGVSGIWVCRCCKTQLRAMFRRNGHYRRQIVTMAGCVTVRVPLIRCRCGHYVNTPWKALLPRARFWYDVILEWARQYLSGPSYRKAAELLSGLTGTEISHMAGWRELQQAGAAARAMKKHLSCPEVVILDEMYVWEKGAKKAALLAMDLRGTVLDFEGPTSRSADNWRRLLDRLGERGVDPDHGLKYVVADGDTSIRQAVEWVWGKAEVQHCVWHILMAIRAEAQRVFGETSRLAKEVVDEARAVLMHRDRTSEARERAAERLAAFLKKHVGKPWAEIMARCYTQATTYLTSPSLPCTNGTAERAIKELRRRIKTMDGFKSHMGAKNLLAVLIQWYNWWRDTHSASRPMHRAVLP